MVAQGDLNRQCTIEIEKDLNASMQQLSGYSEYIMDAIERKEQGVGAGKSMVIRGKNAIGVGMTQFEDMIKQKLGSQR
jgi:hypothetical protein